MESSEETLNNMALTELTSIPKISQTETQWSWDDMYAVMGFAFFMGETVSGTAEQIVWSTNFEKLLDKATDKIKMLTNQRDEAWKLLDLIESDLSIDFDEYTRLLEEEQEE